MPLCCLSASLFGSVQVWVGSVSYHAGLCALGFSAPITPSLISQDHVYRFTGYLGFPLSHGCLGCYQLKWKFLFFFETQLCHVIFFFLLKLFTPNGGEAGTGTRLLGQRSCFAHSLISSLFSMAWWILSLKAISVKICSLLQQNTQGDQLIRRRGLGSQFYSFRV